VTENLRVFGETAKGLARNPLGIIALFIVLVYGVAALVTAFARSMEPGERQPLIWFLVLFPPIVLAVFAWLVSKHPGKLYGPGDYRDEENYRRILLGQLEAKVLLPPATAGVPDSSPTPAVRLTTHSDPRLAIAQVRLEIERELFLLSRSHYPKGVDFQEHYRVDSRARQSRPVSEYLSLLEKNEAIDPELASNLREFVQLANAIVHGQRVDDAEAERSAMVGSTLVADLRHKRLVADLLRDFDGHVLWHHQRKMATEGKANEKYVFWSAVAASLPDFEYDYDVYREAAETHNNKQDRLGSERTKLYVLSISEFVEVLEFRAKELQRIIDLWGPSGWTPVPTDRSEDEAIYWQWPREWGEIGWNGPMLRERRHLQGAEEDLMRTQAAINHYRPRLEKRPRP